MGRQRVSVEGYTVHTLIYEGPQTRVWSGIRSADGLPVAIKEYHGLGAAERYARCEREYALMSLLDSDRVVKGVEVCGFGATTLLITRLIEGKSLAQWQQGEPFQVHRALALTIELAEALAHLHRRGVVHRDVKPENVLIGVEGQVVLIDLGAATDLVQSMEAQTGEARVCGTLYYLAPEQTGRLGITVDYRADYYGLGCTLYQLLTGCPPFADETTAAGLMHAQLARTPAPLSERMPAVPSCISKVAAKLLSKAPADRYQGARGLIHDLRCCQTLVEDGAASEHFVPGAADRPERLVAGTKLFGRDYALEQLEGTLAEVTDKSRKLVVVQGASGNGKTSLVRALLSNIHLRRGRYAEGKFDMLQRSQPYAALMDVFRGLITDLEGRDEEQRALICERIRTIPSLSTLLYFLPDLAVLQCASGSAATPPSNSEESRVALQHAIAMLFRAFCVAGEPLVVFLDDMQWADQGTIAMVENLVTEPAAGGFLIIAAHRTEEVGNSHPWAVTMERIAKDHAPPVLVSVGPLSETDTERLLEECLSRPGEVTELAQVVHQKTAANPYFVHQFLQLAVQRRELYVDETDGEWRWNLDALAEVASSDNVVQVLLARIDALAPEVQEVLIKASAVADRFNLGLMATLMDAPPYEVSCLLESAVKAGLIRPCSEQLRLLRAPQMDLGQAYSIFYGFSHDRVRSALYSLLGKRTAATHLAIASKLQHSPEPLSDRHRQMAYHGTRSRALVHDPSLAKALAEACFQAGNEALGSGLYEQAHDLLGHCVGFLDRVPPGPGYSELLFEAKLLCVRAGRMAGLSAQAWSLAETLQGKTPIEQLRVYIERADFAGDYRTWQQGLQEVQAGLKAAGVSLAMKPTAARALAEVGRAELLLARMGRGNLTALPQLADPLRCEVQRMLGRGLLIGYQAGEQTLYVVIIARMLRLALVHGISALGVEALQLFSFLNITLFKRFRYARELSDISLGLIERYDDAAPLAHVHFYRAILIEHWNAPSLQPLLNRMQKAFLLLYNVGHDSNAHIILANQAWALLCYAPRLQEARVVCAQMLDHTRRFTDPDRRNYASDSADLCELLASGSKALQQTPMVDRGKQVLTTRYAAVRLRLLAALLWWEDEPLEALLAEVQETQSAECGTVIDVVVPVLLMLAQWHLVRQGRTSPRRASKQATKHLKQLRTRFRESPALGGAIYELGQALAASLAEEWQQALRFCDAAETRAKIHAQPLWGALASEVATDLCLRHRDVDRALFYAGQAAMNLSAWGAEALVQRLQARVQGQLERSGETERVAELCHAFDKLSPEGGPVVLGQPGYATTKIAGLGLNMTVDREAFGTLLVDTTSRLAELTERAPLLQQSSRTLLAGAGATRVIIFELGTGHLKAVVTCEAANNENGSETRVTVDPTAVDYPHSIVDRALKTGVVSLPNAVASGTHTRDPYVVRTSLRSVLCVPIVRSDRQEHLLYLENRLIPTLFGPSLREAIAALGVPLSIALRNAELIGQLESTNTELRAALKQATAADAAKSVFLENMSHELRTPLNGIMGNAELLKASPLNEDQTALLCGIRDAGEALLKHIANILDFAQLTSGRPSLSLSTFAPAASLGKLLSSFRFEADTAGTELQFHDELPAHTWVSADEGRLGRAVSHLLDNALKYANCSLIQLRVRSGAQDELLIEVSDNGCGLDHDKQELLFNFFEQGDAGTKKKVSGIGLGLATVKQIVSLMQGELTLDSRPNAGVRFTLKLPCRFVDRPQTTRDSQVEMPPAKSGAPRKLAMIVEDNRMNQKIVQRIVSRMGFEVELCEDGLVAVSTYEARSHEVAFILMDCQMPNMDGYEATGRIRELERSQGRPRVPIIALTANALEGDQQKCFDAGMDRFLAKPLRPQDLRTLVLGGEAAGTEK